LGREFLSVIFLLSEIYLRMQHWWVFIPEIVLRVSEWSIVYFSSGYGSYKLKLSLFYFFLGAFGSLAIKLFLLVPQSFWSAHACSIITSGNKCPYFALM
jgi:hypothetical protein